MTVIRRLRSEEFLKLSNDIGFRLGESYQVLIRYPNLHRKLFFNAFFNN